MSTITPKEKLYYLLKTYSKAEYDTKTFSDQFSYIYYLKSGNEIFTDVEKEAFEALAIVTDRFSPYEEDLKIPNAYFNEEEVREKVKEVLKKLNVIID